MSRLRCDLPNDDAAAAPVGVANIGDRTTLYSETIESSQLGRNLPNVAIPTPTESRRPEDVTVRVECHAPNRAAAGVELT